VTRPAPVPGSTPARDGEGPARVGADLRPGPAARSRRPTGNPRSRRFAVGALVRARTGRGFVPLRGPHPQPPPSVFVVPSDLCGTMRHKVGRGDRMAGVRRLLLPELRPNVAHGCSKSHRHPVSRKVGLNVKHVSQILDHRFLALRNRPHSQESPGGIAHFPSLLEHVVAEIHPFLRFQPCAQGRNVFLPGLE
jgi:hypothetical protein